MGKAALHLMQGSEKRDIKRKKDGQFPTRLQKPCTALVREGSKADQISLPIATAVSAMRLEKPHSLSYQLRIRTMLPSITLVWSVWNTEECGSWLKSLLTSWRSVYPRMPLSGPSAALRTAALISSASVARDAVKVRSTTDTFGVGTRIATPSSLPFNSGRTSPTALAAPVEVGIMLSPAARARYRSLCIVSSVG